MNHRDDHHEWIHRFNAIAAEPNPYSRQTVGPTPFAIRTILQLNALRAHGAQFPPDPLECGWQPRPHRVIAVVDDLASDPQLVAASVPRRNYVRKHLAWRSFWGSICKEVADERGAA